MNDLEVAQLVLKSTSAADGGCTECIQGCIDEAICAHPELPWEEAVTTIGLEYRQQTMTTAIARARAWLDGGNQPRVREGLPEVVIQ